MDESQELNAAKEAFISGLGIPTRILNCIKASVADTPAVTCVMRKEGSIVVLTGREGCGKSVAAALWIDTYVRADSKWKRTEDGYHYTEPAPVWTSAPELSRVDHYDVNGIQRLLLATRLVIDDVGEEYLDKHGFLESLLNEVLSVRHGWLRPTLITTRIPPGLFIERYGERIRSRIREDGLMFGCGEDDLRRRKPETGITWSDKE
jgi:hypothetical protein